MSGGSGPEFGQGFDGGLPFGTGDRPRPNGRPTSGRHARHASPHPHRTGHAVNIVTKVLAATLSLVLLVGFGYGWYEYRSLNNGLQRLHLSSLGSDNANSGSGSHAQGVEQNFLVVGIDSRSGLSAAERRMLSLGNADSLATDTIMIIHVPANGAKATMISIPRDSYVDIPGGYLKNKINAAYADAYTYSSGSDKQKQAAGANELVATVSQLTGLTINHYIQVGFGGFYTITQALGDIPVDLCAATDDTLAHNEATGQGHVGSNFKMSAGKHNLTPVQALEFVRQRHNLVGGDLAREKRQRYFLTQAFKKISSMGVLLNPGKLGNLIKAITGTFYVDDNGFSLTDLADQMSNLSANNIVGYTIPTQGSQFVSIGGVQSSVEVVDPAKVKAKIAQVLAGTSAGGKGATTAGSSGSSRPAAGASASGGAPSAGSASPTHKPTAGCIY